MRDNNLELVQEILKDISRVAHHDSTAAELARILQEPHFQVGDKPKQTGQREEKICGQSSTILMLLNAATYFICACV